MVGEEAALLRGQGLASSGFSPPSEDWYLIPAFH